MISARNYIRVLLLTVILTALFQTVAFSQGTDLKTRFKKGFFTGITFGPSKTNIVNEGTLTGTGLTSTPENTFFWNFDAGYFFSGSFGLSTGLGYHKYSTRFSLADYDNSYDTTDFENESYTRLVTGSNINELQEITFLTLPIKINIQIPFGKNFGLFLNTGISLSFPVNKSYYSSGTFSYSGFYSSYNVTFSDIPYEGFKSNVSNNVNGGLEIKSMIPEFVSSAGFHFLLARNLQFSAGIFYNLMLSDLSEYQSSTSFRLSSIENNLNSIMAGSEKVTASSMGINFSIRYFLKR
jgi:OmpA-OmpF porin, OOP family